MDGQAVRYARIVRTVPETSTVWPDATVNRETVARLGWAVIHKITDDGGTRSKARRRARGFE
jgi:hypothetical protein